MHYVLLFSDTDAGRQSVSECSSFCNMSKLPGGSSAGYIPSYYCGISRLNPLTCLGICYLLTIRGMIHQVGSSQTRNISQQDGNSHEFTPGSPGEAAQKKWTIFQDNSGRRHEMAIVGFTGLIQIVRRFQSNRLTIDRYVFNDFQKQSVLKHQISRNIL